MMHLEIDKVPETKNAGITPGVSNFGANFAP